MYDLPTGPCVFISFDSNNNKYLHMDAEARNIINNFSLVIFCFLSSIQYTYYQTYIFNR